MQSVAILRKCTAKIIRVEPLTLDGSMTGTRYANPSLPPLLRWAGSKRKLIPELLKQVPENFDRYVEPFCGSACLFFALRPKLALISDLNQDLIETYRVIRAHPRMVFRAVSRMPRTDQFYYRIRSRQPTRLDEVEGAARFVYLNRNCFNGVFRTNRSGQFNVPRGSRGGQIPSQSHFFRSAIALRRADIVSGDFETVLPSIKKGDFVYLDPPYAKAGSRRRGEYGYASFDTPDLERLQRCLSAIDGTGAVFLLSYASCPEIQKIARGWNSKAILVRRHVAGFNEHRMTVKELLISNRTLRS